MLKTNCTVCGKNRKFKSLMYDHELRPYCVNPLQCSEHHPNSHSNCKQRGTFLNLLTYEEASHTQRERFTHTYEETAHQSGKRIRNVDLSTLATGTVTFRTKSEAQADYIAYIMAKIGSNAISTVMQYILQGAMDIDQAFITSYTTRRGDYKSEKIVAAPITKDELPPLPRETTSTTKADEGIFTL
jgi:hypothetical protein